LSPVEEVKLPATRVTREVVVFSKKGCHLCEAVEVEMRAMTGIGMSLKMDDIDEDSELYGRYWLRVPVVRVGGEDVFEAKMMDQKGEWKKRLAQLLE
jgi:hypothetical protein